MGGQVWKYGKWIKVQMGGCGAGSEGGIAHSTATKSKRHLRTICSYVWRSEGGGGGLSPNPRHIDWYVLDQLS